MKIVWTKSPPITSKEIGGELDTSIIIFFIWIASIIIFSGVIFIKHLHFMKTAKHWKAVVKDAKTMGILNEVMNDMDISTDLNIISSKAVSVPTMTGIFNPIFFLLESDLAKIITPSNKY